MENKKILHINAALDDLSEGQLGIEIVEDSDLSFKMWGGKDYVGSVVKFLAKNKPALIESLTISSFSTGILQSTFSGVIFSGLLTLRDLNTYISDASLAAASTLQVTFDIRGAAKHVTNSAPSGGGTTDGVIVLGVGAGLVYALRVKANGNTTDSTIEFFTDSGLTDQIYLASNEDCYTDPYFVDKTAWPCFSFINDLTQDGIYYKITNDGANASTYDIELFGIGNEKFQVSP